MEKSNYNHVVDVVKRLNWLYGKGSISNVWLFGDGRITFDQTPYGCKTQSRRGRVHGNTVFALGHQRTYESNK